MTSWLFSCVTPNTLKTPRGLQLQDHLQKLTYTHSLTSVERPEGLLRCRCRKRSYLPTSRSLCAATCTGNYIYPTYQMVRAAMLLRLSWIKCCRADLYGHKGARYMTGVKSTQHKTSPHTRPDSLRRGGRCAPFPVL